MLVLGIETSCDEAACALVEDGKNILAHVVASQIALHQPFKGVFPELASRKHIDTLLPTLQETCRQAEVNLSAIDLIAVTKGPGLVGSLLIGLDIAKTLSVSLNKPLVGVNHVEAHLYAAMMTPAPLLFPALGVVVSGGHTFLVKIERQDHYECLGSTIDDALGEAFDKVARLLDLPYPGGPEIEKIAALGAQDRFPFKAGTVKHNPLDFSFSGLKTQVLYAFQKLSHPSEQDKADLAAGFQKTAFLDLVKKTLKASQSFPCQSVIFGGGVTSSLTLRRLFKDSFPSLPLFWPSKELSLDNGVMIAGLGYHLFKKRGADTLALEVEPQNRLYSRR